MGTRYLVQNGAMTTTAPLVPVTTSATLFTMLQLVPSANTPLYVVEFGMSFDGSAAATPFPYDLVETGTVAATVTAFAAADVMPWGDANDPANTAGAGGVPLNLGVGASGYTSSAEGSATTNRVFSPAQIAPVNQFVQQYPQDARPKVKPGNVLRLRIKGDGTRKVTCYIIFEI